MLDRTYTVVGISYSSLHLASVLQTKYFLSEAAAERFLFALLFVKHVINDSKPLSTKRNRGRFDSGSTKTSISERKKFPSFSNRHRSLPGSAKSSLCSNKEASREGSLLRHKFFQFHHELVTALRMCVRNVNLIQFPSVLQFCHGPSVKNHQNDILSIH